MPLLANSRLGPYEIKSTLGAGGMGEVYRARDTRLNRDVAIKVLREDDAASAGSRSRFEREARAIAALNHPNIVAVYDFGVEAGQQYIVSELVEGESLRALLPGKPVPIRKLLDIATQVTDGLAAAHAAGVVHRDLKPENIMLARDGRVKILDFGLARHDRVASASDDGRAPTLTIVPDGADSGSITKAGAVLGTARYMSPEQALGKPIGYRSDQFSFGLVLYELVAGKQAFLRPSTVETMAAIVREEPAPLDEKLPAPLRWIIDRCLQKEPEQRYESTRDLYQELRNLRDHLSEAHSSAVFAPIASPKKPGSRWKTPLAVGLLVGVIAALLILVGALYLVHRKSEAGGAAESADQDVRVSPLTALPGYVGWPALSPDGKQVVFAWDGGRNAAKGMSDLYIKVIGGERIQQLTHQPSEEISPAWSPDGSTIAFARSNETERGIFTMSVLGGPERKLDAFTNDLYGSAYSLSWSADGRQLIYEAKRDLRLLTVETGEMRTIERPQQCKWAFLPVFSPDGKWIALLCRTTSGAFDLYRISPMGERARNLHTFVDQPTAIAWSGDSQRIILADSGGLLEVDVNGGQPRRLSFAQTAVSQVDQIASRGNRLVYVQVQDNVNIWRIDLRSESVRSLLAPTSRQQKAPTISPDGKRIAFESDRSGSKEVWVANLDGSDAVQLSDFHVQTGTPRWSPDGRKIVFDSRASGEAGLYLVDPSTALPRRIFTNGISACVPTWSADGKWIYFTTVSSPQWEHDAIYKVAPEGGTPELVTSTHGYNVQESRDGRVLYFFAGEANAPIRVLDRATGQEQPLKGMPNIGDTTDWVVGSKGIFYIDRTSTPAAVAFYEFSSARVTRRFPIEKQFEHWGGLALSPDET
jgi:eukaryotic-like serine/threonine-protein kinase